MKLEKTNTYTPYAFVCFKTAEASSQARQQFNQMEIDGKNLVIEHYELKEFRKLQKEEEQD